MSHEDPFAIKKSHGVYTDDPAWILSAGTYQVTRGGNTSLLMVKEGETMRLPLEIKDSVVAPIEYLIEQLNRASEYAGLSDHYTFAGEALPEGQGEVTMGGGTYLVDIAWAIGNVKRLPDRCSGAQMIEALAASHPDVKRRWSKIMPSFYPEKEYSPEELKLIAHFGYLDLAKFVDAPGLYRLCAEKAFIDDMKGPAVEALRRAARALRDCAPYRMTAHFNDLVRF